MSMTEPQNLIEVLSRMECPAHEKLSGDSRSFKRFILREEANLEPIDNKTTRQQSLLNVMLRDISVGGVRFLCENMLDINSIWRINFNQHGYRTNTQPISIRFCKLVQESLYLIGAQFVIEPHTLHCLGIDPHELTHDIDNTQNPSDEDDTFLPPQMLNDL